MTDSEKRLDKTDDNQVPKYHVCIEGKEYPWDTPTIAAEEIITLGGWDLSVEVIEIDRENNERTLQSGETVELKLGHGFSKKVCWKRGLTTCQERIEEELTVLRRKYPSLKYMPEGQWVIIPSYTIGAGWNPSVGEVAFQIPPNGYPGTPPYGIYVRAGLRHNGCVPANYREPAPNHPPIDGSWGVFSWAPQNGHWRPAASAESGANLLNWVEGFSSRFREGR